MSSEWGASLRAFRESRGLTQGEFSDSVSKLWLSLTNSERDVLEKIGIEYLDLSSADVSRYENARRKPRHRSRYISFIFALYKLDAIKTLDEANNWLLGGGQEVLTDDEQIAIFESVPSIECETGEQYHEQNDDLAAPLSLAVGDVDPVGEQSAPKQNASRTLAHSDLIVEREPSTRIDKTTIRAFWWFLASVGILFSALEGRHVLDSLRDRLEVSEPIVTSTNTPTALPTARPTALPTPLPTQESTEGQVTASPLLIQRVSLHENANDLIQNYIPGFEYSDQVSFNNIEFDIAKGEVVRTHCSIFPDDTRETISFEDINIAGVHQVFLLINGAATDLVNVGDRVGVVTFRFTDDTQTETELIIGHNIREWRVGAANTISQASHQSLVHVYSGTSSRDDAAVVDMLSIEVAPVDRVKVLSAIEVTDTSRLDAGSTNPCLFIYGISLKYR